MVDDIHVTRFPAESPAKAVQDIKNITYLISMSYIDIFDTYPVHEFSFLKTGLRWHTGRGP
jgi:hypothetical protein